MDGSGNQNPVQLVLDFLCESAALPGSCACVSENQIAERILGQLPSGQGLFAVTIMGL